MIGPPGSGNTFGLPQAIKARALLTVGYPKDTDATSVKKRKPLEEIFYRDKWRGR